jgi:DNA-3-methyladenine glycosylase II
VLAATVAALSRVPAAARADPFEALVSSVTAQQVSLHRGLRGAQPFIDRFGEPRELASPSHAGARRAATEEELTALGFSRRKAEYVLGLGAHELDFDALETLPDDEVKERPDRAARPRRMERGLVPRPLSRRPHAWPAGDLGLRKAVLAFYPETTDVRAAGVRFHPFENLSAHFLLLALRYQ